ncbi:MAG: L-threonylcarbamoyladenylate synthase [Rickettsiaceae bacterium]|nr:L-threonylcarbamoyladenylate synthase [Rickettsiaceae bacterium]
MLVSYKKALDLILASEIVAVPTETVYGLAGDATSDRAVLKIYDTKKRPKYNPLIIHVNSAEQAMRYGEFTEDATKLAANFWPGPMTLVLKRKKSDISSIATAGLDTIAIRCPSHPKIRKLIEDSKKPLAAPSANLYTKLSPTKSSHVEMGFGGMIPVLNGGSSIFGIESTIIECLERISILRHGFITSDIISKILGFTPYYDNSSGKSPGSDKVHYSPECKMRINADFARDNEIAVNFGMVPIGGAKAFNLSKKGDLIEAASKLYDILSKCDREAKLLGSESIAVAKIPELGIGLAINDKLKRGAKT